MKIRRALALAVGVTAAFASPLLHAQDTKHARPAVEILWDSWGVPHIFAHDEPSAFRAFGWAQMHNDADALLRLIAQARGRGAEIYGAQYLNTDRTIRLLGVYSRARAVYQEMSPEARRDVDAFVAGINEYANEHPEKLSPASKSVLPVSAVDDLAVQTRLAYDQVRTDGCNFNLSNGADSSRGSNGWAIGPAHSASGHAMLLANPHLPWDSGEFTFFEAQISAPGYELYGAALLGVPVLGIGFNDLHGWTETRNRIRACDTYALVADGKGGYLFNGMSHAFDVQHDLIKVKQDDGTLKDEPFEVRQSVLGPVYEKDGKFYAVRVPGLQVGSYAGQNQQFWDMGRARNLREFQAALRRMQILPFNVIYADRGGNIELLYDGLDPVRTADMARPGVLPGDSMASVWNEFYNYDELPKAVNPASGFVQNSNSPPWYMTEPFLDPARYPPDIAPVDPPNLREERGIKMITEVPRLSYDQMGADQYSTHSQLADLVLKDLVAAAKGSKEPLAQQAAPVLEAWDGNVDADSKGAYLFYAWWANAIRTAQNTKSEVFAVPFDPQHPIDTPRGFKNPDAAVAALVAAVGDLQKQNVSLDVPWGQVFRLRRGKFDFPGSGASGAIGIFDVIEYERAKDGIFEPAAGDTFMAQVEFSSPLKAKVLLTYGNSTNPDSPHYGDQLALFAKKEWRQAWRTRAALAGHIEERTVLPEER